MPRECARPPLGQILVTYVPGSDAAARTVEKAIVHFLSFRMQHFLAAPLIDLNSYEIFACVRFSINIPCSGCWRRFFLVRCPPGAG